MCLKKMMAIIVLLVLIIPGQLTISEDDRNEVVLESQKEAGSNHPLELSVTDKGFIENNGQYSDPEIEFVYSSNGLVYGFTKSGYSISQWRENEGMGGDGVNLVFDGANKIHPTGEKALPHVSNFLIGSEPEAWNVDGTNYEQIRYSDLYPGIDLVFYSTEKGLKYDLLVAPGGDPDQIRFVYEDADSMRLDDDGNVVVTTGVMELIEEAPFSYQGIDGTVIEIPSEFEIVGNALTFGLDGYDPDVALIIDPLLYSTYFGGDADESPLDMVIDAHGDLFVVGRTFSSDFPNSSGAYNESNAGDSDMFLAKFDGDTMGLLYCTYIGGSYFDIAGSVTLDAEGNVYIGGWTGSSDFPTTEGCFRDTLDGQECIVVLKLDPSGSNLIYSTYIGNGYCGDIVLNDAGGMIAVGTSRSDGFPTTEGAYSRVKSDGEDVVVFSLSADGSELIFSTFIGGDGSDFGYDLELDSGEDIIIAGFTSSTDFPVTNGCIDDSHNGNYDVFVAKFDSDCSNLLYSTYYGGSERDMAQKMTIDGEGVVYVTGLTESDDFPTSENAFDDSKNSGYQDSYVLILDLSENNVITSTFIASGAGYDLKLDENGKLWVTGKTMSAGFPSVPGDYDALSPDTNDAGFLIGMDRTATSVSYSMLIGGDGEDARSSMLAELDAEGRVFIALMTDSSDLPTTPDCYDNSSNGGDDIFFMVIDPVILPSSASIESISPLKANVGQKITFRGSGIGTGGYNITAYNWTSEGDVLYNGSANNFTRNDLPAGYYRIALRVQDVFGIWSENVTQTITIGYYSNYDRDEVIFPISISDHRQRDPRTHQNKVVWEDRRHGNYDIFLFDYDDPNKIIPITNTPAMSERDPRIIGTDVIWMEGKDVYYYDLENGPENGSLLFTMEKTPGFFELTEGYVLWSISDPNSQYSNFDDYVFMLYDLESGEISELFRFNGQAAVDKDTIVYISEPSATYSSSVIKRYSIEKGHGTGNFSVPRSSHDIRELSLSWNLLAYTDTREYKDENSIFGTRNNYDVYLIDLEEKTFARLTENISKDGEPSMSLGDLVFVDSKSGSPSIWKFRQETVSLFCEISENGTTHSDPDMSGSNVVWVNDNLIYFYRPKVERSLPRDIVFEDLPHRDDPNDGGNDDGNGGGGEYIAEDNDDPGYYSTSNPIFLFPAVLFIIGVGLLVFFARKIKRVSGLMIGGTVVMVLGILITAILLPTITYSPSEYDEWEKENPQGNSVMVAGTIANASEETLLGIPIYQYHLKGSENTFICTENVGEEGDFIMVDVTKNELGMSEISSQFNSFFLYCIMFLPGLLGILLISVSYYFEKDEKQVPPPQQQIPIIPPPPPPNQIDQGMGHNN